MLRMIEGPKQYLNARTDGPFAFCAETDLDAYNATEWLFGYAQDAVETQGASWEDFGDAEGILSTYVLMFQNDETGEVHQQYLRAEEISLRGVAILNAAIEGENVEELFAAWRSDLYDEANTPR